MSKRSEVRKLSGAIAGLMVAVILITGSSFSYPTLQLVWAQEQDEGTPLKVALLTDALFSDGGWGATAYNASQALKEKYGLELTAVENVAIPDIEPTLRDFADQGNKLIIAHGFEWGDPALRVGADYPDTKFVVFTGLTNGSNVASVFPMQQEGAFVLGAVAAMMSKTGTIGFVGGQAYPNIINIFEGYKQGARYINPDIKVIGQYIDTFTDPARGKEAGVSLINNGADFLFHVADLSGQGVIQAAKEKGIYALGVVADQHNLAPDTVLTSFVLDMEKAFDQAINMVQNGNFSGQLYKPGLEAAKGASGDGIVFIAPFHNLDSKVPADVKQKLNQIVQDIISGKIVVPERTEASS
jgi:basic membrane protein A and related proteins